MKTRQLHVGELVEPRRSRFGLDRRSPLLRLAGQWLAAAGFKRGDAVQVKVEVGQVTITHVLAPGQPTRAEIEALRAIINGTPDPPA